MQLVDLARHAVSLRLAIVPDAVIDKVKACLLHNLAVARAGATQPCVVQALAAVPGGTGAHCLVDGRPLAPESAAFVNGVLLHSRLQDDAFRTSAHPGSVIIPAALAVAEEMGATGAALLEALLVGYEMMGAVICDRLPAIAQRGFRSSSIFGGIGAAAACGRLMGATAPVMQHAMGLAASFAFGTTEGIVAGTNEWRFQPGLAARNGLLAARLAHAGATAAPGALDGPFGLYRAFAGEPPAAAEDVGKSYHVMEITFKRFPVAMIDQIPIQLLLDLLQEGPVPPDQVVRVALKLNPFEANYPGVSDRNFGSLAEPTLASAPLSLALAWFVGPLTLASLGALARPDVQRLAARIFVEADPGRPPARPRLEVTLADGTTVIREYPTDRHPLALDLSGVAAMDGPLWAEIGAHPNGYQELVTTIAHLEAAPNMDRLVNCLCAT